MNNDENEADIVENTDQLGVYDYDDDEDLDFDECLNEYMSDEEDNESTEPEVEKRLKENFE